jgi:hypothetical protein
VTDFETKERQEFSSGMHRDTESGKPRFDLIVPEGIPFEEQLLTRFAALMARGAEKYTERNWEQANSEEEINRARSSAFRHFFQWFCGEMDEDHAVAVLFNIMVVETTRAKLARQEEASRFVELLGPVRISAQTVSRETIALATGVPVEDLDQGEHGDADALNESLNRRDSSGFPIEDLWSR